MKSAARSSLSFVVVTIGLFSATQSMVFGQSSDVTLSTLEQEYAPALRELREYYSRARGAGVETIEQTSRSGQIIQKKLKCNYIIFDDLCKVSTSPVSDDGDPTSRKSANVRSVAEKYAFSARPGQGELPVVLESIEETDVNKNNDIALIVNQFKNNYILAPLCAGSPIEEFLLGGKLAIDRGENVSITKIEKLIYENKNCLKISYTRRILVQGNPRESNCWIIVSPEESWVLKEHESCIGRGCRNVKIEYENSGSKIPAPKQVVITTGPIKSTFVFTSFLHEPGIAKSEFALSSEGLPEINIADTHKSFFYFAAIAILLGAIGLAIVAVLKKVAHRPTRSD